MCVEYIKTDLKTDYLKKINHKVAIQDKHINSRKTQTGVFEATWKCPYMPHHIPPPYEDECHSCTVQNIDSHHVNSIKRILQSTGQAECIGKAQNGLPLTAHWQAHTQQVRQLFIYFVLLWTIPTKRPKASITDEIISQVLPLCRYWSPQQPEHDGGDALWIHKSWSWLNDAKPRWWEAW